MEVEAKFSIPSPQGFQRLLDVRQWAGFDVGEVEIKRVHDRYLDTAERSFLKGGFSCRVRVYGGRHLLTLKSLTPAEGAMHSREELEVWLDPQAGDDVDRWPQGEASALAKKLSQGRPLELLFAVWQERHVALLRRPGSGEPVIELNLDRVRLVEAEQAEFLELEAELRPAGQREDLDALASVLASEWRLSPESRSKFERGLALAHPELAHELSAARQGP